MAKMMSNDYKFFASNHGFVGNKLDNLSPVMIKMPAASSNLRKSSSDFFGRRVALGRRVGTQVAAASNTTMMSISSSISIGGKSLLRWWEKGLQPNMKEISGAQDLVESLLSAGDKLVVVDFFSPGCGGCKALHPKICQLAEMNPDVQFLQVNYEDHKSMCYSLNVHVLPFFRFYRGADGRVCSFSCTNATIKKFKDALAKYKPTTSGCSLGPPKGLDEKDLVALAANRDLSFTYTPKPNHSQTEIVAPPAPMPLSSSLSELPLPRPLKSKEDNKDKTFVSSGR